MANDQNEEEHKRYWKANIRIVSILLAIWFLVSCVLSILVVVPLNATKIGGFPLGFWFAQQGSIYTFILLILVYALIMDKVDRKFHVDETADENDQGSGEDEE